MRTVTWPPPGGAGQIPMRGAAAPPRILEMPAEKVRPDVLGSLMAAYVALLPFQYPIVTEVRVAPADLFIFLAIFAAPTRIKFQRDAWSVWHVALLVIFAIGTFVTALNEGSLNRYVVLNKDIGVVFLLIGYTVLTSTMSAWSTLRRLMRVFVLSVVLQNLVGIAAFLAAITAGIETPLIGFGRRLCGLLVDPNAYGGLLVLALVLCEAGCYGPWPLFRTRLLWLCRISLGAGIVLTFSRSSWISLALVLLILAIVRLRAAARIALAGGAALTVLFAMAGERFLPVLKDMASRPEQVHSRMDLIIQALAEFSRHPWIGAGLGAFREAQGTIVHNTPLWFLAEFGLLGFAVFAGLMLWYFRKALWGYRFAPVEHRPIMLGLLLGHIAMLGLAMGIEAFYQRHWWMALAMIACAHSLARRSTRPPAGVASTPYYGRM